MKEVIGKIFSIGQDNAPLPGCTISRMVQDGVNSITYYSLAAHTDISAEIYPYHKLILIAEGNLEVYASQGRKINPSQDSSSRLFLASGEAILTPTDQPVGLRTAVDTVYTEIFISKEDNMNQVIKAGEVFQLKELVPYQEGKIVNMDVVHSDTMKLVVMAFDQGTGLSEHAAPGEALIFALDGDGILGYEGQEYPIKAGENFHFAKGGLHYVKAPSRFKMALFLTLE